MKISAPLHDANKANTITNALSDIIFSIEEKIDYFKCNSTIEVMKNYFSNINDETVYIKTHKVRLLIDEIDKSLTEMNSLNKLLGTMFVDPKENRTNGPIEVVGMLVEDDDD